MKVVVLQSNYIPWKGYFELINDADVFCFYDEVQYTKNDWRNRNRILGPNGLFWLTIPIAKEAVKLKISEVAIERHDWQVKHFRTIEQTYAKSINKKEVLELLSPIYLEQNWTSLSELNQHLIKNIAQFIGIKTQFKNSADYNLDGDRLDRLTNLIDQLGGKEYISGPAAKDYLDGNEYLFEQKGIKLSYKKYGPYIPYDNKKKTFEDGASIVDLIMNVPHEEVIKHLSSL